MMKQLDLPPVWLLGFAVIGGLFGRVLPWSLGANGLVGWGLIALGLVLMVVAVLQMMGSRTTVIPRRDPEALVSGGVFRLSRNPIYLADAILLAGVYIALDALIALPLVLVFMRVIERRFIRDEEARLARHFGESFDEYRNRTRRWL